MTTDRQRLQQTLLARKTAFDNDIKAHPEWTREFKLAYWVEFLARVEADANQLKKIDDVSAYNRSLEEALEFERTNARKLRRLVG